jgi:hypothetical protein
MAIDFPASPTLNDVFTVGNVTYVWDGTKWTASVTGGISLDKIEEGNTSAEVIDTGSDGRFVVTTEGTERLFVNSNGNISVGSSLNDSVGSTTTLTVDQTSGNGQISLGANGTVRGRIFADNSTGELRIGNPTAGDLMLYTNNTERLRIDSSGRLGIGTSSPGDALTVQGTGNSYIGLQSATSGYASLKQIVTDTSAWLRTETSHPLYLGTNQTRAITIDTSQRVGIGTTTVSRELILYKASAPSFHIQNSTSGTGEFDGFAFSSIGADATIWNYENGYLRFGTNDTERLRIDSSGRVGIGTTPSSDSRLHVKSGANDSNPILRLEAATGNFLNFRQTGSVYDIHVTANDPLSFTIGASERARIDSSGRLLVGTSTSNSNTNSKFQIADTSGNVTTTSYSANNSNAGYYYFLKTRGTSVDSHTVLQSGDGIANLFFTGSDGTTYRGAASIEAVADGGWSSGDAPGRLVFSTTADGASSPTERMRINTGGEFIFRNSAGFYPFTDNALRLGDTSNRWSAVYAVNGTIQTSDQRAKANIVDSQLGTNFVKSLRPVSYKWIEGGKRDTGERDEDNNYIYESVPGTRTHWGFIAQEVKQAVDAAGVDFGGWVLTDKDDPDSQQALRYDQFIAPLTKALQEAMERIETLEGMVAVNNITIDEQQHQLSTLAARLTALESA